MAARGSTKRCDAGTKTALQYALTLAEGDEIRQEHLPTLLAARPSGAATQGAAPPITTPPPLRTLAEIEGELVRRTLEESDGNLALAARRLGIARSTLYRHLRRSEEPAVAAGGEPHPKPWALLIGVLILIVRPPRGG